MKSGRAWCRSILVGLVVWAAAILPSAAHDGATSSSEQLVDFDTQIIPILTRQGCNRGSCHGSAAGRGGFRLSLYGGDPAADFRAITWELGGRRIHRADADRSLLLRKPTEDLEHGGGYVLDADSEAAMLIRRWIAQGARRLQRRRVERVEFSPAHLRVERAGERVALRATAYYDDGSSEDVTRWTAWTTVDDTAVRLDLEQHTVQVERPGRHLVLARFLDVVAPLEIILPYGRSTSRNPSIDGTASAKGQAVQRHPIDRLVEERLAELGLKPSEVVGDYAFLRRVSLDLTGRLPSVDEVVAFAGDLDRDKRTVWIDRMLDSEEFTIFWTYRLATWWRVRAPGRGRSRDVIAAQAFQQWIRESLEQRTGLDEMARQLVTATGDSHVHGAATFFRLANGPRELAEVFSETMMGVRLRCANCHNHPLDQWTQDDYHGLAALFAGVQAGRVVRDRGHGEVIHPRTSLPAVPRIPGEAAPVTGGRQQLASWLTAPENPYFARAMVNRVWAALLGKGLVEPVDDMRRTNPAVNERLLEWLSQAWKDHAYDLRWLVRTIVTSDTYQRRWNPKATAVEQRMGASASARPLAAEVLADALADVTGVAWKFEGHPDQTRAIMLADVEMPSRALDILGRCDRKGTCQGAAPKVSGLARTLHLLNGDTLNRLVGDRQGFLHRRLESGVSDRDLLRECYLRALSRPPTSSEEGHWLKLLTETEGGSEELRRAAWEDFWWALLCSREFTTNH